MPWRMSKKVSFSDSKKSSVSDSKKSSDSKKKASSKNSSSGGRAETAAVDYLATQGFSILATNLRLGPLEIDVVARKGPLVVVVEVRTRGERSYQRALESVSRAKQERLVRAARRLWRDRFAADASAERLRFDVIAVSFEAGSVRIEHVAGAFTG
jgi:putative endonuclease